MLTKGEIFNIVAGNEFALMARFGHPFPAMLMAERERTNPSRGVLSRVPAFREGKRK